MKLYDSTLTSDFLQLISPTEYTPQLGGISLTQPTRNAVSKYGFLVIHWDAFPPFQSSLGTKTRSLLATVRAHNKGLLQHLTPAPVYIPLCLKNVMGLISPCKYLVPLVPIRMLGLSSPAHSGTDAPSKPMAAPEEHCAACENRTRPAEKGQEAPVYVGLPGRVLLLLTIPWDLNNKPQVMLQTSLHSLHPWPQVAPVKADPKAQLLLLPVHTSISPAPYVALPPVGPAETGTAGRDPSKHRLSICQEPRQLPSFTCLLPEDLKETHDF